MTLLKVVQRLIWKLSVSQGCVESVRAGAGTNDHASFFIVAHWFLAEFGGKIIYFFSWFGDNCFLFRPKVFMLYCGSLNATSWMWNEMLIYLGLRVSRRPGDYWWCLLVAAGAVYGHWLKVITVSVRPSAGADITDRAPTHSHCHTYTASCTQYT